jgi:hypothetical protein
MAKKEVLENRLSQLSRPFQAKPDQGRTGARNHPKHKQKLEQDDDSKKSSRSSDVV